MTDEYPDYVLHARRASYDAGTRADPSKDAQAIVDAIEKLTAEVRRLANMVAETKRPRTGW